MSARFDISSQDELAALTREDVLRERVIIPLLQRMGLQAIYHNHGPNELGKDIVAWYSGPLGEQQNIAVVVKAGKVAGLVATKVADQVNQAFNTSFRTGTDNIHRKAHSVWVTTNGNIPPMSKETILSLVSEDKHNRLLWIDGSKLWALWNEHFPVTLERVRSVLQENVSRIDDPAIIAREWVEADKRGIAISVRDASRLTEKHTRGSLRFVGGESPEGQTAFQDLQRFFKTGQKVDISGRHLKHTLPEVLEKLRHDQFGPTSDENSVVTLSTAETPERYPVKLEVRCEDGEYAELEYIDWRILQAGTEKITFVNDAQPLPIKIKMVFASTTSDARYTMELVEAPVSAHWIARWMQLQRCLSKPGKIVLTVVKSGQKLTVTDFKHHTPVDFTDEDFHFFQQLAIIEQILGQPIVVPDRIGGKDRRILELLLNLLHNPTLEEAWTRGQLEYAAEVPDEGMDQLLSGSEFQLTLSQREIVDFSRSTLDLGMVDLEFEAMKIENLEDVRRQIKGREIGENAEAIQVKVVPGSSKRRRKTYHIFVDAEPAKAFRRSSKPTAR